jgi:tetratricopeptide (TPR) repeat protein
MKRISFKIVCSLFALLALQDLKAQTIEDALKYFKYERYASAKAILEPISAGNALANYYLGLCQIGLDKKEEAKATFQKFPDDVANQSGIARLMFMEGKANDGKTLVAKIASKAKKKDYMPLKFAADAITYSQGGDPNEAVALYKRALAINRNADLLLSIGDAYRKIQGGGGDAMTSYEYAEEVEAFKSIANYKMGNHWYAAKNYDSALAKYAKASLYDDKNPLPYRDLANAYYKVGKYSISKDNIEKYLKLSDNSIEDQIQYANTLYQAREYKMAIDKMNELISKGSERPYMYRVIGYSQYEMKDYVAAKNSLDMLFKKQETSKIIPLDYINYGKILMQDSTKTAEANMNFDKGLAIDTSEDKNYIYRELAEAFKTKEDYKSAAKWYSKIVDSGLPTIQSLDAWWAGVLSYFAGDYPQAEIMLNKMAAKYPDYKSTYFYLARNKVGSADKDFQNGAGVEPYKKWLGMVNDDPAENDNLKKAYSYLGNVAVAKGNKEEAIMYSTKMNAIDPNDGTAKYLMQMIAAMK